MSRSSYELHDIEAGTPGLLAKFAYMRGLVAAALPAPIIRATAVRIVEHGPQRDADSDLRLIDAWLRRTVRYTRDPLGVELFTDPRLLVHGGAGDCDDLVMLGAALLESIGYATRFAAGGMATGDAWVHVWLEVLTPHGWRAQDATAPPGVDPRGKFPRELRETAAGTTTPPRAATMNATNVVRVPRDWHCLTPGARNAAASDLSGFGRKLRKAVSKVTKPIAKVVPKPIRKAVATVARPIQKIAKTTYKLQAQLPQKLIRKQFDLVGKAAPAAPLLSLVPGVGTAIAAGAVAAGAIAQQRAQQQRARAEAAQQAQWAAQQEQQTAPPLYYGGDEYYDDTAYGDEMLYAEPAQDWGAPLYDDQYEPLGWGSSTEWGGDEYWPPVEWGEQYGADGALYGFSLGKLFKKGKKAARQYGGVALQAAASGALGTGVQNVVQQGMGIESRLRALRARMMPQGPTAPPRREQAPPPPMRPGVYGPTQPRQERQYGPPAPAPAKEGLPPWVIPAGIAGVLLVVMMKR